MAPGGMTSTLVPWKPPLASHWAFMDDRNLNARGANSSADLAAATEYTEKFDKAIGAIENASKRQDWSKETEHRVEHLGLTVIPGQPDAPNLPRGGWEKLFTAISRLGRLPGSTSIRERMAGAFVRPLWR